MVPDNFLLLQMVAGFRVNIGVIILVTVVLIFCTRYLTVMEIIALEWCLSMSYWSPLVNGGRQTAQGAHKNYYFNRN